MALADSAQDMSIPTMYGAAAHSYILSMLSKESTWLRRSPRILPAAAARHRERTALVVNDKRLSFKELDALSNRVANGFVAIGVQPGDRVSLFGANSWEWVVAYYGIAK